ncbi:Piso0_001961 [Millerozyma farinosa CBS 7064]|uniref:UDP-galactose transporter homolog 1 n=1 Tax=Pichia sorbitophila (strain ATCC MYA-4447 / BCRC 22081 / CBS 7064 / NBRC 10061 / NRRL Y-12695) TaxID=559304 RepID=G8YBB4_PICSO|nr:Piso0_001961 [Millerozyma farinosa CBS 7064]
MGEKKYSSSITLCFSVLGLYASFLTWSVLQERINTKPYGSADGITEPEFFKAPLIINVTQALLASITGYIYSYINQKSDPFDIFFKNDRETARSMFKSFVLISITSSLSSPVGYSSLKHIDFLAYLLAKSCKLIPVMLVHKAFYRTKFPFYKYLVAVMVTAGVAIFTLSHSSKKSSKDEINDGNIALGVGQLLGSMLLDGLTNSTQDQLFKLQNTKGSPAKLSGAKLMCVLNAFVFVLTLAYTIAFKYESEVTYTINFAKKYPEVLTNILQFSACGAFGQVFVFIILENFGSLVLITATVTRKMISMILSVVLFGHTLNYMQWLGVGFVFGGIGYEAYLNLLSKKSSKATIEKKNN